MNAGDDIFVKIMASNIKGDSPLSEVGTGAVVIGVPDKPINIAQVDDERTYNTLGISWEAGIFNGGSVLIDYRINMAE